MKVAVVTPYYKEPIEILDRCINSVKAQTHPDVFHVLVSDGHPSVVTEHTVLLPNTGDMGDTPRLIGSAYASAKGADAIIFLDADCWLDVTHVEKMVEAQQKSGALILTNPRKIWCKFTNDYFGVDTESDGISFNDTNCYMITRPAFQVINKWGFKPMNKGLVGDRFFWECCIRFGAPIARATQALTNYSSDFACHYEMFHKPVPDLAKLIKHDGEKFVYTYHKDRT